MRILSIWLLLSAATASAQTSLEYFLPEGTYNPDVPTPKDLLGYEVGEWHVSHDQLTYYMRSMAEASNRIVLEEYARSYENRPLVSLYITSPENHARLDEIKSNRQKIKSGQQVNGPLVVWLGYSVHGNEASGANASMLTAYYLAAAQGSYIEELLQNTVIILDPSYNPDGLNRFASWVNTHKSTTPNPDANDREHNEAWPRGRTNHYWFDLNRDWMPVQHPESQGRIRRFHEWVPNILTDHHEMGTNRTFFFQPGIPSRTFPLTPDQNQQLTRSIGEVHAEYLDSIGSLYYTQESFDDYYIGKGSSYPDIMGCIGILFEQASSRGHAQENPYGTLTFPFAIRNHFVSSLSTLKASQRLRGTLQSYQADFYKNASQGINSGAYVFGDDRDPKKSWELVRILMNHDIDVFKLKTATTLEGQRFGTKAGYVVPTNQPEAKLIQAIFEKRTTFKDSLFYDVSAWTLPLAMDLPGAFASARSSAGLQGTQVTASDQPEGTWQGNKEAYAYLLKPHGYYTYRALNRLLHSGLIVEVLHDTHQSDLGTFPRGTLKIAVGVQPEKASKLKQVLETIRKEDGLDIYGMTTGLAVSGLDLGTPSQDKLHPLKIGVLVGSGVNGYEAGEVWHLLDQRMKTPVTLLPIEDFSTIDLNRYNRLVFPNGRYNRINEKGVKNLEMWLDRGGVAIAWKGGARWLSKTGMASVKYKKSDKNSEKRRAYADYSKYTGAQVTGGTIFQASIDTSHPLGYGLVDTQLALFRNHNDIIEQSENAYAHPLVYSSKPLLSGYVSEENQTRIANSPAAQVASKGNGRVIVLSDNPNFRAFWYGTNRLFLNALYFGHTIDRGTTTR